MWTKRAAWGRNPLRRTSDRIEALLTFVVIMTMLLIGPWVAWSAGRATYRNDVRTTAWERQHRFAVTAVLLQDAARWTGATGAGMPPPASTEAAARWTGPDGTVHIGPVPAYDGALRGSTVRIWVDETGAVADPPGRRSATFDAVMVALLAVLGIGGALGGVHRIVVWRLNRRRLRSWQAEWLVVGPRWSHR